MENQIPQQTNPQPPQKTSMGLEPNLAGALSYLCGWVTGLIFYLLEKENNFVRFHAMQSIITFAGLTAIWIALSIIGFVPYIGWIVSLLGNIIFGLGGFVAWVLLIIKAYQGERWHFPVTGEIAEKNLR